MDPMLLEDPDARPKRLVMLAASGIAAATVFATTAAMVAGTQQRDEATPDFTLKPTATSRPAQTSFQPPLLPPPVPISSIETSQHGTSTSKSTAPTSSGSVIPTEIPPPTPTVPTPTPTRPSPTITRPPTSTKPPTSSTRPPTPTPTSGAETSGGSW
ncbi:hypothetical protein [Saccharopolyspora sp. 5N708]|uniref:hypothetical protein n=1 Tax=Saccharopolyspora sp. 5N708 TaxID=3457424 RepID=UPI003FD1D8F4